jgi:hypothetical protein
MHKLDMDAEPGKAYGCINSIWMLYGHADSKPGG